MSDRAQNGILEEFRLEFLDCWQQLPNRGLFFGLLAAWLALFHFLGNSTFGYVPTASLFGWILNASQGDESHLPLVPLAVLALFYWKRRDLISQPLSMWPPALLLVAFGLVLHVTGYMVQQPRVSIIGMFTGIYGLMGLAWGWRFMRASFFPFFLLAFCIPIGSLAERVTFPLRMLVSYLSVGIAQVAGLDVVRDGSLIYNAQRTFQFDVAPACSGIRSLVALLALTTLFGFLSFRSTWRRVVMVLAAFPLAVLGNVTRITFTIFVAEIMGQKAGAAVEQKFGFVTFAVAIVCILLIERWLREPASESPTTSDAEVKSQ